MAGNTTEESLEVFRTWNVSGSDISQLNCNEFFAMTDQDLFRFISCVRWTIGELMFADNLGKITASLGFNNIEVTTEYIGVWLLLHFSRPEKKRFLALFGKNFDSRNKIENFCKLHRWVKSKFPEFPTMFRTMTFVNNKVFDVTNLIHKLDIERETIAYEFGLNIDELKIQRTLCDLIIFLHTKGFKYHVSRILLWDFMRSTRTEPLCSPYLKGLCKYSKKGMLQFSNVGEYLEWFDQLYEMYVRERTAAGKSVNNKEGFILGFWDEQQMLLHNKPITSSLILRHDGSIPEMKMPLGPIDQLFALNKEAIELVFEAIGVEPYNITECTSTFLTLKRNLEFLGVKFEEPKDFYKPFWNRLEIGGKDTKYFEKEYGVPTEEPLETVQELIEWVAASHKYLCRNWRDIRDGKLKKSHTNKTKAKLLLKGLNDIEEMATNKLKLVKQMLSPKDQSKHSPRDSDQLLEVNPLDTSQLDEDLVEADDPDDQLPLKLLLKVAQIDESQLNVQKKIDDDHSHKSSQCEMPSKSEKETQHAGAKTSETKLVASEAEKADTVETKKPKTAAIINKQEDSQTNAVQTPEKGESTLNNITPQTEIDQSTRQTQNMELSPKNPNQPEETSLKFITSHGSDVGNKNANKLERSPQKNTTEENSLAVSHVEYKSLKKDLGHQMQATFLEMPETEEKDRLQFADLLSISSLSESAEFTAAENSKVISQDIKNATVDSIDAACQTEQIKPMLQDATTQTLESEFTQPAKKSSLSTSDSFTDGSGHTDCYNNALFKVFIHCEEFSKLAAEKKTPCKGSKANPKCIACQFAIKSAGFFDGVAIDPERDFTGVMLRGTHNMQSLTHRQEQDVHEFMLALFEECSNTQLHKLFAFNEVKSVRCSAKKHNHEDKVVPSKCLTLHFPTEDTGRIYSVKELLDYTTASYVNDDEEEDSGCVAKEVKLKIKNASVVLIFQLARFSEVGGNKNQDFVALTQILQVSGHRYELYAVIRHNGDTATEGHYHTILKTEDEWRNISGGIVENEEIEELEADSTAYLLFYRRAKKISPGSTNPTESERNVLRYCKTAEMSRLLKKFSSKIKKPEAFSQITTISVQDLKKYYDVGLCVIAVDGVMVDILQQRISYHLVISGLYGKKDLTEQLKLIDLSESSFSILTFIDAVSPPSVTSELSRKQVNENFATWNSQLPGAYHSRLTKKSAFENVANVFERLKALYKRYTDYHWPEGVKLALQKDSIKAELMQDAVLQSMTRDDIMTALRIDIIEENFRISRVPLAQLIAIAQEIQETDSVWDQFAENCRNERNKLVHSCKMQNFANESQRAEFLENFKKFVENFPSDYVSPFDMRSTEHRKMEYLLPLHGYHCFVNVENEFHRLNEKCDDNIAVARELRNDCKKIYEELEKCCKSVSKLMSQKRSTKTPTL